MIARRSARWILPPLVLAPVLIVFGHPVWGGALAGLGGLLVVFFRDPRRSPRGEGMLAPADGRILAVEGDRISIFMSPFNVHVNRAPLPGRVEDIAYRPGGYRPAFTKDSEYNERNIITLKTTHGPVRVTQIAGWFARRIECYVDLGDHVERGERLGMIRFASRTNVTLPKNMHPLVERGDRVRAGETVIAIAGARV